MTLKQFGAVVTAVLVFTALMVLNSENKTLGKDQAQALSVVTDKLRQDMESPGLSIAVQKSDGQVITSASGFADLEDKEPLTASHIFFAGSTGKVLFAAVTLQLVDEGILSLDDLASEWLGDEAWFSEVPNGSELTLGMLLNHKTGLMHNALVPEFKADLVSLIKTDPDEAMSPFQFMTYSFGKDPIAQPGEEITYSDANFILLALIVEKVTGRPFYDLINERILEPNGLDPYFFPQRDRNFPNLATGYWDPETNFLGLKNNHNKNEKGELIYNPSFEWAGGGFASNPEGLARLATLLYGQKVVSNTTAEAMFKGTEFRKTETLKLDYGLGVIIAEQNGETMVGHSGSFPGYQTVMFFFPADQVSIALMTNKETTADLYSAVYTIKRELFGGTF